MMPPRMLLVAAAAATVACTAGVVRAAGVQACSVGTSFVVGTASGPPHSVTTVTGVGFDAGTVTIHWATPTGPVLATTAGPLFSKIPFTIPNVAPGLYYVDAWDGTGLDYIAATFRVTAIASAPAANGAPQASSGPPALNGATGPAAATAPQRGASPATSPLRQERPATGSFGSATLPVTSRAPAAQTAPVPADAGAPVSAQPQGEPPGIWGQLGDLASGFQPGRVVTPAASPTAPAASASLSAAMLALMVTAPALGGLALMASRRRRAQRRA